MRIMTLVVDFFPALIKCILLMCLCISCDQLQIGYSQYNKSAPVRNEIGAAFKESPTRKKLFEDSLKRDRMDQFSGYYISGLGEDFDSVGIVVLYVPGTAPQFAQRINMHYKNGDWVVTQTKYNGANLRNNEAGLDVVTHNKIALELSPVVLLDSLKRFDLASIPDQDITGSQVLTEDTSLLKRALIDSDYYIIDIATKDYYHIVQYREPEAYDDKNGYNKKVVAFISFIKNNIVDFNQQ